jgi:hypothetical protein
MKWSKVKNKVKYSFYEKSLVGLTPKSLLGKFLMKSMPRKLSHELKNESQIETKHIENKT